MRNNSKVIFAFSFIFSGCASVSTPPLFFGELVTIGLDIGATPGSAGADFTLGYRDRNLAIVPVSAINGGNANEIVAWSQDNGNNRRDALSVFGQFKSQVKASGEQGAPPGTRKVSLGRFFATGLAATNLAEGFKAGWADNEKAPKTSLKVAAPPPATQTTTEMQNSSPSTTASKNGNSAVSRVVNGAASANAVVRGLGSVTATASSPAYGSASATATADSSNSKARSNSVSSQQNPATPIENYAYAPPLIFGQSNTFGIGVAASVADQGTSFTLGYSGRDIAFVPVMARHADNSLTRLGGRDQIGADGNPVKGPSDSRESDAFSVFGQFEAETETGAVRYGLNRFFTTGIAARTLTEGFSSAIARDLKAQRLSKKNNAVIEDEVQDDK